MKYTQPQSNQPSLSNQSQSNQQSRVHLTSKLTQLIVGMVCALVLSPLLLPTIAHADEDKAPPSGRSSGGRGCGTTSMPVQPGVPAVILLAPGKQLGRTTSTRPTFAWFVRDPSPVPLEFRVYEQQSNGYKLIQEITGDRLISKPGIMVLTPDQSLPELEVGKRYRWQVELICNANRPAGNPLAESLLEVVPMQSTLKNQLQQTRDRASQAKLYDQANLWYDMLNALLTPSKDFTRLKDNDLKDTQAIVFDRVALTPTEQKLLQTSQILPAQR
jgi:hypothetical protein